MSPHGALSPAAKRTETEHRGSGHQANAHRYALATQRIDCRSLPRTCDVFGANAHSNRPRSQVLQAGYLDDRLQLPRCYGRTRVQKYPLDSIVSEYLDLLRYACRKLPPLLHLSEKSFGHAPLAQRYCQQVRRGHGILDRQVDADASSGRHCVCSVANAE